MPRQSRELRALNNARARARERGLPYYVSLGYVLKPENLPRIHVRPGDVRSPKGAELVAVCSSTGLVRILGSWCGAVQVAGDAPATS